MFSQEVSAVILTVEEVGSEVIVEGELKSCHLHVDFGPKSFVQ